MITGPEQLSVAWLSEALGEPVVSLQCSQDRSAWAEQVSIRAELRDGSSRALRLKVCQGTTFGRSEVDYYLRDYVSMPDAPLVRCFAAHHDPAVGYHVLMEDLAATHVDRRDVPPTRAYGIAVAQALGRLHRHHWGSMPAPAESALDRYLAESRPGLATLEQETGEALSASFDAHERAFRQRWREPRGMSLLHGDLNPTNVLTPRGADAPVLFIDRQPFDWSLTYGLAVSDLAYFLIPWWPPGDRQACETDLLWHWHQTLDRPDYRWAEAQADWRLSVAQCLNVPMEWCAQPDTRQRMRWLWTEQLARVRHAMAYPAVPAVER